MDTAGSKAGLSALLNDFEEKRIDVLVGTQMVTKGLDFDNVAFVGILGADGLTKFPDFRSGERAFQLMTQVAGRAGRKNRRGEVLMQAFNTAHPVIQEVLQGDFEGFARRELEERKAFKYPPFYRLIQLELRHKDLKTVQKAADFFAKTLRSKLGERILGPVPSTIARVRNYYGQDILLKLEKSADILHRTKQLILHTRELLIGQKGYTQVIVNINVDPM